MLDLATAYRADDRPARAGFLHVEERDDGQCPGNPEGFFRYGGKIGSRPISDACDGPRLKFRLSGAVMIQDYNRGRRRAQYLHVRPFPGEVSYQDVLPHDGVNWRGLAIGAWEILDGISPAPPCRPRASLPI